MITIKRNQKNNIFLTLNEKTTIDNPFYLIKLFSKQTKTFKVIPLLDDLSNNIVRYNEFIIEENIVEDLNNSIIELDIGGYDYFVYESGTSSLSIEDKTIVESGKFNVEGSDIDRKIYTNNTERIVYK